MSQPVNTRDEWLEADGCGGFSSGTASGVRTRRYHALLLTAATPPTGRLVLANGLEVAVETPAGTYPLSSQSYSPDVVHPDGARRVESFTVDPWPHWRFLLDDGSHVEQEIFVYKGSAAVVVTWRLDRKRDGVRLVARPLISGRDYHALHRENPAFRFDVEQHDGRIVWRPYAGIPGIIALANGEYTHQPEWYRNFLYEQEQARGLDCVEDLASPGLFRWDLSKGEAALILSAESPESEFLTAGLHPGSAASSTPGDCFPARWRYN